MSFIIHAWQPLKRFLWIKYSHRYNSHNNVIFYTFIESCQKIFVKRIMAIYEYPAVQHIGSTQGPHLFSTQNLSVQHQNCLSAKPLYRAFFLRVVLNWGVFSVKLRGFWCETEGCVELRGPQYMLIIHLSCVHTWIFYVSWKGRIWKIK